MNNYSNYQEYDNYPEDDELKAERDMEDREEVKTMSEQERYQLKEALRHIEQMEYHRKIANALLSGIVAQYYAEDYGQEALLNTVQALN